MSENGILNLETGDAAVAINHDTVDAALDLNRQAKQLYCAIANQYNGE